MDNSNARDTYDLSHLIFSCGKIGRLKTLDTLNVLPGDKIDLNLIGSFRMSPLVRGLSVDSKLDVCTFYVPYRHIYGEKFVDFIKAGEKGGVVLDDLQAPADWSHLNFLATTNSIKRRCPKWLYEGYLQIYNNYFKYPADVDFEKSLLALQLDELHNGLACCNLPSIWTAPLPPDSQTSHNLKTTGDNLDIIQLQYEYAKLQTEQEREFFMQRYRDIISNMGGNVSYDADNRPLMLGHSEFWASGYEINGTDQATLGQYNGRVAYNFEHRVPNFFVPEHGVIFTVALVRFPVIHCFEMDYLVNKSKPTYEELAGDSTLLANSPVQDTQVSDYFNYSSKNNGTIKTAPGQHYRYKRNHVDSRFSAMQGYPFLNYEVETLSNKFATCYVQTNWYDQMFQTQQLWHWNVQSRMNAIVDRNIPNVRTSILVND